MSALSTFSVNQVLCIEHDNAFLYSEVIQIAEERSICWVRPLAIKIVHPITHDGGIVNHGSGEEHYTLYDLRQSVDLLLPCILFRPALDTEVLPLIAALGEAKVQSGYRDLAHQQIRRFTHRLWIERPTVFQRSS